MARRRGATSLAGILLVDKPAGMTSHDVVARVRRATGEGRVGHAGTLDPLATGLLVVLVGPYTRLEPYLSSAEKSYLATLRFGAETDTDDAEGAITRTSPTDESLFAPERAREVLRGFLGKSEQQPPAYSAIKVGGQVAHRAARAGGALELAPRPIEVYEAELLSVDADEREWTVAFRVSKGTYVRALARDIGRSAGSAAHLAGLRRTASGASDVAQALSLEDVERAAAVGGIEGLFADPLAALGLPVVEAPRESVECGRSVALSASVQDCAEDTLVAVVAEGELAAVYRRRADLLVPDAVFVRRDAT